jgi:hypothetical protein
MKLLDFIACGVRARQSYSFRRYPVAESTLLVFAHADEAEVFAHAGVPHLVTGVGKINATLTLSEALLNSRTGDAPVGRVVVMGTAGAIGDSASCSTTIRCRRPR